MSETVTRVTLQDHTGERFVPLRRALGVTSFGINQLVLQPGQRMRIHHHERQEEAYLVISGRLTLVVEGEDHDLVPGEIARIAPDVRRQVVNRGPDVLSLVALGGDVAVEHASRDAEAFHDWDDHDPHPITDVPLPDDLPDAERRTA
ncbi:MAG: cupin domain-containing protein [Solirubrobacteraceae bacterium]|nr:cupin domain-containing protein [Solirubrobacteraceae bacterium]